MTCIVGLIHENKVYMGADSAGVAGYNLTQRKDPKVFIKNDFLFGFTSSFRMGQLIQYKLNIPKFYIDQNVDKYLHTSFIDSIIECFKNNNYAKIDNNEVAGGSFLFAFKNKLYKVDSDFQIGESIVNYDACGCGEDLALGCLYGLSKIDMWPNDKIKLALKASEKFSAGVRGPFTILSL